MKTDTICPYCSGSVIAEGEECCEGCRKAFELERNKPGTLLRISSYLNSAPTRYQDFADRVWLAFVTWREARGEGVEGRVAVMFSILNRVQRPSWWGTSIQTVLFKKWQYSSLTDPNDPQLTKWPSDEDPSWKACLSTAFEVMGGRMENPVPGADSYHDISIPSPYWATPEMFVKQVGRLKFYNVDLDYEWSVTKE